MIISRSNKSLIANRDTSNTKTALNVNTSKTNKKYILLCVNKRALQNLLQYGNFSGYSDISSRTTGFNFTLLTHCNVASIPRKTNFIPLFSCFAGSQLSLFCDRRINEKLRESRQNLATEQTR